MKKPGCFFFIIIFTLSPLISQTWSSLKRLSWNSSWSDDPTVAADSGSGIHVVWRDFTPGNHEIFYKRSTDRGTTWLGLKRLTWNAGASRYPIITADSGNGIHVIWDDDTPGNFEIFYKRSTDSGGTWSGPIRLTWNSGTTILPSIAADSGNGIHAVWQDDTPGNEEIFYKHSTDGGATWTGLKRLTWNTDWSFWPTIATDSANRIHVVWYDNTPGNYEIFYKRSTDGGATWSSLQRLTWNASHSMVPNITTDSGTGIHIVWQDFTPGNNEIFYKRSTDSGANWSGLTRLTWTVKSSVNPSISADSSNKIHVTWDEYISPYSEIMYKQSPNNGVSWSGPTRLTWGADNSRSPAIAADPSQGIHIVWEEEPIWNTEIYYKNRK